MPSTVVNTFDDLVINQTFFESIFVFEAIEDVTKHAQLTLDAHFNFVALEELSIVGEGFFESSFEFVALGFLNAEPNITDEIHFETSFDIAADLATFNEGLVLFDAHFEFDAFEEITTPDESSLTFIVDILPTPVGGNYIKQKGRLKVNGADVPFVTATYNETDDRSGSELTVRLARLSDKALITRSAVIEFSIGDLFGGVWSNVETIFNTADQNGVDQTNYSLARQNNAPEDTFTFTSTSEFSRRFSQSPTRNLVLYNPLKMTLSAADFQPIYDTTGARYDTELVPVAGLSFNSLIDLILIGRCGFTAVNTDIEDFPIDRVDCGLGQSFMQSVAGYFGMFEPDIYETAPGVLWIEDSTNGLPSGFPAPRAINIETWTTAQQTSRQRRVDALLVSYKQEVNNFDYTTTRSEITIEETGDFFTENYTSTLREKFFIEYRRFSQPTLVIASHLERETTETTNRHSEIIAESNEVFTYDGQGRITRRTKELSATVPVLPSSSPAYVFIPVLNEVETFEYKQLPFRVKESYLSSRVLETSGVIAFDPDNKQLDKNYKQPILDALRSGNLTQTTEINTGAAIKTLIETAEPNPAGIVTVKVREIDHLQGVESFSSNEDRAGDVGLQTISSKQGVILVFDADVPSPSFDRVERFSAGELGIKAAVALARRVIVKRKTKSNVVNFVKIGFDPSIRKGSVRTVNERGVSPVRSLGVYKIKSRSVTVNRSGIFTSFTGRQV